MGANSLQQSLLDSMQLLSQKAANSTNAAITIKGEIIEELDSSTHQYSVSYGGTVYKDVYSMTSAIYTSSTIVWILIPDGNFDNPKIILGAVSPSASQYVTEEETDMYVPISSNLFGSESSIDLRTWIDESKNVQIDTDNFGLVFKDYLDTYRNFLFTAYIKTEIDKDHQSRGNYGLILNLPFITQDSNGIELPIWKSYVMDTSTIQGNPYAFNEYQRVNLYYTVDDTLTYDMSRVPFIQAFTQDFGYTTPRTDIQYDVHIKNIAVQMVDVLTEADTTGYYLAVVASEGNYFLNGKYANGKTLKPVLKINAKESDITKWDCYWFVEDSSINTTSEGYHLLGGLGWKCVNKKINVAYDAEGNKSFQYVLNNYSLDVAVEDVTSTLRYKCVLTKDDIVVGGSVRLKNLNSSIETTLLSATGSNTFVEGIGDVTLIARIYYPGVTDIDNPTISLSTSWQRFNRNGEFIDDDFYTINRYNDKVEITTATGMVLKCYETEISYPCSNLEKLNTINCSFYSTITNDGTVVNNNLGTESIIVTTSTELSYGVTLSGGDVLYKYDADGDSPLVANYDGPASSRVKHIEPITYKVFKPDGKELNETEYLYAKYRWSFPKNSMMKLEGYSTQQLKDLEQDDDYYYITGYGRSSINYTILTAYNKKKSNNTILIRIDFDNCILTDSVNPKFLKDGEGGTNGSKYSAVLNYLDYAYGERDGNGKIRKMQFAYIAGAGWRLYDVASESLVPVGSPQLTVAVYKDGDRINSGYNVSWQMFDFTTTNPCFGVNNGVVSVTAQWTDASTIFCSIVECKITITENSQTNSQEVIYAYYPIEITRLISSELTDKIIPTLDGGFEEVVYASDGTNPQYDNTNPFECTNNVYHNDEDDLYDYVWEASSNLKVPAGVEPTSAIKPVTKFDNGLTKNYVKVALTMSAVKRAEVQAKIDELAGKITETQNLIAFYQHNEQHILDFAEKFSYNNYEGYLKEAKNLLQYRFNMLNIIPSLRDILEEMNTYCIAHGIRISDFNYTRYYSNYNTTLNTVYKNLYLLGYNREFGDINDLSSCTMILNEALIRTNYGAAVAQQLKIFVQSWTSLISNKYQVYYAQLVRQNAGSYILQPEYDKLHILDQSIIGLPQDSDLYYLTNVHDQVDPAQEFINLKEQLTTLANRIKDESNSLLSYSAFVSDLLGPIQSLFSIYQNTSYQIKYYTDLDTKLNEELTEYQTQKAGYEASLLPASANYITHIKPIVMVFNRYELSNINGWNGSKLYIDQTNNEYLLAPQVGAGIKTNGLFTGVIMGIKQFNAKSTQHIGLFGYGNGIQSYFMNAEDGSVIMGKSGSGQMVIDPSSSKALLYSSNYWKNYKEDGKPTSYGSINYNGQGMLLDLTTPEIRFGSGNFVVDSSGHITAKGGGSIAGWNISDTELYSNVTKANGRVTLDSTNYGKIYSHNHNSLTSTNTGFYLAYDGLSLGNSIRVSSVDGGSVEVGRLSGSRHWTINGSSSESYIAFGTSSLNSTSNSVYLGTDGISLGEDKFWVTRAGNLHSKSGDIGGWSISSSTLKGGNTTLYSNGKIECENLVANSTGSIGGWTINSNHLSGGNTTLNSNGTITCSRLIANTEGSIGGWTIGSNSLSGNGLVLGTGQITGPNFSLGSSGLSFTAGGTSVAANGNTSLTESRTTLGGKNIKTRIEELCVGKITADYVQARIAELSTLNAISISATSNISAGGAIIAHGGVFDGSSNLGNKIAAIEERLDDMAEYGDAIAGTIVDSMGGTCSYVLYIDRP